jgi:cysteinyl-tRNA synthetase
MTLQSYQEQLNEKINQQEQLLADLAKQISQMQMELRWEKKKANDQSQIAKDFEKWYSEGRKLMEDLCGAFPKEALQDVAEKVMEISEEVANNYDSLEQQYTYLMREVELVEPSKVLVAPEQKTEKTEPEITKYIEEKLEALPQEGLTKVAQMLGTRATKSKTIASFWGDSKPTKEDIDKLIAVVLSLLPKPLQGTQLTIEVEND